MAADATYGPAIYKKDGGNTMVVAAGGSIVNDAGGSAVFSVRTRVPIASVNAGATLLPAVVGKKYRIVDCEVIAVGGAVGAVTTIDILGTQATSSVKLVSFAQAQLTQSTVLYPGITGATILADGASFAPCDANAAVTINITGSAATTATNIDVMINYALES